MAILGKTHKAALDYCPYCGAGLDAMTAFDHKGPPKPGEAITICIICAQPLFFDAGGKLRKPVHGELETLYFKYPKLARQIQVATTAVKSVDRSSTKVKFKKP
jgi:hypothetical protein